MKFSSSPMRPCVAGCRTVFPVSDLMRMLTVFGCAAIMLGCAQIRQATYPQDFVYLEQKQISSEMALMSLYLRQIDELLLDDATISTEQQGRILAILSKIDASADKLGAGSVMTNHLLIDDHIDRFKADVNVALYNVRANPPNYYALGRLSGSCAACHQLRKN